MNIVIGVDGLSMVHGGGLSHLINVLRAADPARDGFHKLVVAGTPALLDAIPDPSWMTKVRVTGAAASYLGRAAMRYTMLPAWFRKHGCDVCLIPGGTLPLWVGSRMVTISQNLLPFDPAEKARYGFGFKRLRLELLRRTQMLSFVQADGVIFLSEYARQAVSGCLPHPARQAVIIPHGIEERFRSAPREQRGIEAYSAAAPFRLLYVSMVDRYKHHIEVAEAVAALRRQGLPLAVDFVGAGTHPALPRLRARLAQLDAGEFVRYRGAIPFGRLDAAYREADAFLFASTCENLPNILIEAMASGLPIVCSQKRPMPDVLGDAGIYFDAEDPASIRKAILELAASPERRARMARASFEKAAAYSWQRCAICTFSFLKSIALTDWPHESPQDRRVRAY